MPTVQSKILAGGNLFYSCISRAVYLSDEVWYIIGKINENGIRGVGLIDKYAKDINIDDAIAKVASDTEINGNETLAGHLYMAANVSCNFNYNFGFPSDSNYFCSYYLGIS